MERMAPDEVADDMQIPAGHVDWREETEVGGKSAGLRGVAPSGVQPKGNQRLFRCSKKAVRRQPYPRGAGFPTLPGVRGEEPRPGFGVGTPSGFQGGSPDR